MEVVDVWLNIARPVQPSELMHYVIRCIYDRLNERSIYDKLDTELRNDLSLAFERTSFNMVRKREESQQRTLGLRETILDTLSVKWATKRSRVLSAEHSYLGYDDRAAEHDVIRISQRLSLGYVPHGSWWSRYLFGGRRSSASPMRLKIVMVFDELDKLEECASEPGSAKRAIDDVLSALKNLFTTSGISFIFVAGKDLHDRWIEDVGRGDSVYESVFAYDKYLPCLWLDVGTMCDGWLSPVQPLDPYPQFVFDEFKKYIAYRGRGIPRLVIRSFNEYVKWDATSPVLLFRAQDVRRIRCFAQLSDLLNAHSRVLFGESQEAAGTQNDRRRLGVHYLVDWILKQGDRVFFITPLPSTRQCRRERRSRTPLSASG